MSNSHKTPRRPFHITFRLIGFFPTAVLTLALVLATMVPVQRQETRLSLADDPLATQPAAWSSSVSIAPAAVSTVAGTDTYQRIDGPAGTGSFWDPIGMTVHGGYGYAVDDGYVRKINLSSGAVASVAGGGSGCTDNADPTKVGIGFAGGNTVTDGSYLYFPDSSCGYSGQGGIVRRMNLQSGAVSTVGSGWYAKALTIGADGALYLSNGSSQINRVDLTTMQISLYVDLPAQPASRGDLGIGVVALAADSTSLWVQARGESPPDQFNGIIRVDPGNTPTLTTVVREDATNGMYADGPMVSAGSYLYAIGAWSHVLRIDKTTGATVNIAGAADGFRDGTGAQAWLRGNASGIDTDGTSIYIDDVGNRRIRRLDVGQSGPQSASPLWQHTVAMAAGDVSTFAGSGDNGWTDGSATSAQFGSLSGLAIAAGNGYTIDSGRVRKIALVNGAVTTISGDGSGGCVDSPDPSSAGIGTPWGPPATDGQYLYFADAGCGLGSGAGQLRRVSLATGAVSTFGPVRYANQVTVGPTGDLITARGNRIAKVDPVSGVETTITDLPNLDIPGGNYPVEVTGLTSDADSTWITGSVRNRENAFGVVFRLQVLSSGTVVTRVLRLQSDHDYQTGPSGPVVSAGDFLYAAGSFNRLLRYSKTDGAMASIAGASGGFRDGTGPEGWFSSITGIDTDGTSLYVSDSGNHRIRRISVGVPATSTQPIDWSASSTVGTVAGARVVAGTGDNTITDGPASAASFSSLDGLTIAAGYGYTYDQGRLRKINLATGAVSTVAGGTPDCNDDTTGTAAGLGSPRMGLVNDGRFLFWADATCGAGSGQGIVRRMSLATGAVSTVHGNIYVYALTIGPDGSLIGLEGANLVRIDPDAGVVGDPLATLPAQTITNANGNITVNGIAADGKYVYLAGHIQNPWTSWGLVDKVDLSTGQVSVVWQQANTGLSPDGPIVSAGGQLYLVMTGVDLFSGIANYRGIAALAKTGGSPVPISGGTAGGPLFLDDQYLGGGNITGLDVTGGHIYAAATGTRRLYELSHVPATGPTGFEATAGNNPAEDARCGRCDADPVDLDTGNSFGYEQDLTVPGRGDNLDLTRSYDTRMANIDGPFGFGWTEPYNMSLTVDANSQRVTIRQGNGSTVDFYPFGSTYFAKSTVLATLRRESSGIWFYQVRGKEVYHFDSSGRYTAVESMAKYATELDYANGRLADVRETDQRRLTFSYNDQGRVSMVTDPAGRTVTYSYDAVGNLTDVTDVDGRHWSYGYDSNHRLTTTTDPRGNSVVTTYDSAGRAIRQQDRDGGIVHISYGDSQTDGSHTTTVTHANATTDQYLFRNHQVVSETHGFGSSQAATTSYEYDPVTGSPTRVEDPLGHVTTMTYDPAGNMTSETDPLGQVWAATYNSNDEPVTVTDQLGVTTTYVYSADRGVLQSVSTPLTGTDPVQNRVYTFGHSDSAHPEDVSYQIDPNGHRTEYSYDAYGYLASTTDASGRTTTATHTIVGFQTSRIDPDGNTQGSNAGAYTTIYSDFTGFGQPRTVTDGQGRQQHFAYDADQNLTDVSDGDSVAEHLGYNNSNEQTSVTMANGSTSTTGYDGNGNITSETDALGHQRTSTFDALDRLASTTDPLGRITAYGYDAASRLTSVTAPGGTNGLTTSYTYDADDRMIATTYSDGTTPSVSYDYDALGRRTSMSDGTGTSTYQWDSLNRLVSETQGNGATIGYGYDLSGARTSVKYPGIAQAVLESRDDAGRLTSITDPAGRQTSFTYDDDDITGIAYPNLVRDVRNYDSTGRPLDVSTSYGPDVLSRIRYTYTAGDRLASASPMQGALGGDQNFSYTTQGQVASAGNGTGWSYDAAGRLSTSPTTTGSNHYNADDSLAVAAVFQPGASLAYDARGNRTSTYISRSPYATYTYDQANRLTSTSGSTGTMASYTYNGIGQRMSKTVSRQDGRQIDYEPTQHMVWDDTEASPRLLSDGINSYIYGPTGPIEQIDVNGTPTYLHSDGRGSTVVLTDTSGSAIGRYQYDAYGAVKGHTGTATTPLQYDGEYTDAETGFSYLRARYYDPKTAQFLSADPLVLRTRSAYGFANDDPLNLQDPDGLKAKASGEKDNLWSDLTDPLHGKVTWHDFADWASDGGGPFEPMINHFKTEIGQYNNGCSQSQMFLTGIKGTGETALNLYLGGVEDGALQKLEESGHEGLARALDWLNQLG